MIIKDETAPPGARPLCSIVRPVCSGELWRDITGSTLMSRYNTTTNTHNTLLHYHFYLHPQYKLLLLIPTIYSLMWYMYNVVINRHTLWSIIQLALWALKSTLACLASSFLTSALRPCDPTKDNHPLPKIQKLSQFFMKILCFPKIQCFLYKSLEPICIPL